MGVQWLQKKGNSKEIRQERKKHYNSQNLSQGNKTKSPTARNMWTYEYKSNGKEQARKLQTDNEIPHNESQDLKQVRKAIE